MIDDEDVTWARGLGRAGPSAKTSLIAVTRPAMRQGPVIGQIPATFVKYASPAGENQRLFLASSVHKLAGALTAHPRRVEPRAPMLAIEGIKKAIAFQAQSSRLWAVAVPGVYNLVHQTSLLMELLRARPRTLYVCFDSDPIGSAARVNTEKAIDRIAALCGASGIAVCVIRVPMLSKDAKTGLDDYLKSLPPAQRVAAVDRLIDQAEKRTGEEELPRWKRDVLLLVRNLAGEFRVSGDVIRFRCPHCFTLDSVKLEKKGDRIAVSLFCGCGRESRALLRGEDRAVAVDRVLKRLELSQEKLNRMLLAPKLPKRLRSVPRMLKSGRSVRHVSRVTGIDRRTILPLLGNRIAKVETENFPLGGRPAAGLALASGESSSRTPRIRGLDPVEPSLAERAEATPRSSPDVLATERSPDQSTENVQRGSNGLSRLRRVVMTHDVPLLADKTGRPAREREAAWGWKK